MMVKRHISWIASSFSLVYLFKFSPLKENSEHWITCRGCVCLRMFTLFKTISISYPTVFFTSFFIFWSYKIVSKTIQKIYTMSSVCRCACVPYILFESLSYVYFERFQNIYWMYEVKKKLCCAKMFSITNVLLLGLFSP